MTYFGTKDEIYDTLTKLSKKTLFFMKKSQRQIQSNPALRHQNEKIKLTYDKTIEEH